MKRYIKTKMPDDQNSQQIHSFQEAYRRIEELVDENKLGDAYRACLELLRFDPENISLIRLKNKIEKKVREYNRKIIQQELKNLKPLWDEEKYEELLENLKKLAVYIDDYPELKKIILKAEKRYKQKFLGDQKKYYQQEFQNIQNLINEKKFPEALRNAEKLRLLNLKDQEIKKMIHKLREQWIENEIDTHQSLIHSEKFEDILLFYQQLKKIDPESRLLDYHIEKTKKLYQEYKIDQKKELIYQGLEEIRTLYQLKKYEEALMAAQEILDIDPNNKKAKKLYRKAKNKSRKQIQKEVILQMLNAQKQLKLAYEKAPDTIKKI